MIMTRSARGRLGDYITLHADAPNLWAMVASHRLMGGGSATVHEVEEVLRDFVPDRFDDRGDFIGRSWQTVLLA